MTLAEMMDAITTPTDQKMNGSLVQFLRSYAALIQDSGIPALGVRGMLSGIASTLQIINEYGIPSDLQEIMDGEKIT